MQDMMEEAMAEQEQEEEEEEEEVDVQVQAIMTELIQGRLDTVSPLPSLAPLTSKEEQEEQEEQVLPLSN